MGLVSTWLNGIGLGEAVPTFQAAGIVTPAALAELDVTHFEALGVSDSDDRRKLFYLVQRIKMAVQKGKKDEDSIEDKVEAVFSGTTKLQEEKKEETRRSDASSPTKVLQKSDETIRNQPKNGTPLRRSRRLARKSEATKEYISARSSPDKTNRESPRLESPTKASQTRKESSPKVEKKAPSPKLTRRLASPRVKVEKRQEDNENEHGDHSTETGSIKSSAHGSASRAAALKRASNVFNLDEQDDTVTKDHRATTGAPKTSPADRSTGLKKPTAIASSSASNNSIRKSGAEKVNSGKSLHAGKRLSIIPSDTVAPMSPLQSDDQLVDQERQSELLSKHRRQLSGESQASKGSSTVEECNHSRRRPKSMGPIHNGDATKPTADIRRYSSTQSDLNGSSRTNRMSIDSSFKGKPPHAFVQGSTQSESWATQIEHLREDNRADYELFCDDDQEVHEYDMRIRVIVKKRPLSKAEANLSGGVDVIHPLDYGEYGKVLVYQPKTRVDLTKQIETIPFAYDNVYDESSTNLEIYQRSLRSLIQPFFRGQYSTVFAYGQTGSGKTYTMMGSNMTGINAGTSKPDSANLGLYYLAALDIFEMIKRQEYANLRIQVSLFEIYGGKLFDLLNARKQVKCLEDSKGKVCFPGLTEHPISDPDRLMSLIEEGASNRSTGTTSRNADSSRSHAVLQLKLRKDVGRHKNVEHGRLSFIDLAGSERGADTSNSSRATRLEGAEINTSLLALKEVIRALATGGSMTHIPFRGSKLTQVLKDSFVGDDSRCCMVACVSPDIANCEQTLNTLRYADRVKERDSDSGALANGYEKPVKLHRLNGIEEHPKKVCIENSSDISFEDDYRESQDCNNLNEGSQNNEASESTRVGKSHRVQTTQKQLAGEALIANHREVMSTMLSMVKDEMVLVNEVDADRDGLDEYLEQVESMQSKQIELISRLRQSLGVYVTACEAPSQDMLDAVASDDESFEDLRDEC